MFHIELSDEEYELLHDMLTTRVHDLQHEIHHTDQREFRARLERQLALLQRFLDQVGTRRAERQAGK